MYPSPNPAYEVASAVRMADPGGPDLRSQIISNGDFDSGSLLPWTTDTNYEGTQMTVIDGAA